MAPHSLDTILRPPQWPASLSDFVTWCLLWDPKARPTSTQALAHEFFRDAADPLRPKSSSTSRLLGRKQSNLSTNDSIKDIPDLQHTLSTKSSSWFRKSLIQRELSAPAVPQHVQPVQAASRPPPMQHSVSEATALKAPAVASSANKRNTWAIGLPPNAAPIPILPTIKPISPLSNAVTAQAQARNAPSDDKASRKIGRQLSVASHGNHYAELHRQEAERALNGHSGLTSPTNGQKESFFSHLRKRARRFSGRYQAPLSPSSDDIEANAGCSPFQSNRQSMIVDSLPPVANPLPSNDFTELDRALQNVRSSLEASSQSSLVPPPGSKQRTNGNSFLKRHHSVPHNQDQRGSDYASNNANKFRRAARSGHSNLHYDTPDEEEELLDEALTSAQSAAQNLDKHAQNSYLTPASSAHQHGVGYGQPQYASSAKPMDILKPQAQQQNSYTSKWPTPPYEESDWAAAAAASIFAAQAAYR
jgi:meiosis induction protein kinase IME2/SME1